MEQCKIVDAIISHGCFLDECSIQNSIVGVRSRLGSGVEFEDTMMMGADYYQTESEIASMLAEGNVPIGVGKNTKIRMWLLLIKRRMQNVCLTETTLRSLVSMGYSIEEASLAMERCGQMFQLLN